MGFFKGLLGAATGFLTGGVPGAIAGGVGGLASSGGAKASASGNQNTRSTEEMKLRMMSGNEARTQIGAYETINAGEMNPTAAANFRQAEYDRLFGSSSRAINTSANLAQDKGYAADARRGLSGATASGARHDQREGLRQNALADASANAEGQAIQATLAEREMRMQASRDAMARINSIWANRTKGSKITRTSNTTSGSTTTGPDTFGSSIAAGIGSALTDQDSYLNKNLLGGI